MVDFHTECHFGAFGLDYAEYALISAGLVRQLGWNDRVPSTFVVQDNEQMAYMLMDRQYQRYEDQFIDYISPDYSGFRAYLPNRLAKTVLTAIEPGIIAKQEFNETLQRHLSDPNSNLSVEQAAQSPEKWQTIADTLHSALTPLLSKKF